VKHYHFAHSADPGFSVVCGVNSCQKTHNNIKALCRHMRCKHRIFYEEHVIPLNTRPSLAVSTNENSAYDSHCIVDNTANFSDADADLSHISSISGANPQSLSDKHVALWSLKLREVHRISGTACEEIRQNVADMLLQSRTDLANSVKTKMYALHSMPVKAVLDVLNVPSVHEISFENLGKEHQINNYVQKNFIFVQPVQYKMRNLSADDSNIERMQYVPLLQTLRALMQNDDIFASVVNSHQSADNRMRDFCDGSYFKNHNLFSKDMHALQIVLYYDEFCAVNPLGHRAKMYKVCAFYFMLGNVVPKDRSRLHTIYLVALCFSTAIKRCGFREVLRPLINDLTLLAQQGLLIERTDVTMTLHGALCAVVADNLAAHSIGGFFESFSSMHPCRFCLIRKDKFNT